MKKWCDEVSGKFVYGSEPKDVYRRHDNCTCTVTYESGRGGTNKFMRQNADGINGVDARDRAGFKVTITRTG